MFTGIQFRISYCMFSRTVPSRKSLCKRPAQTVVNIAVCRSKVARIPRVGYVPAVIGKIHELSDLILRVAAEMHVILRMFARSIPMKRSYFS